MGRKKRTQLRDLELEAQVAAFLYSQGNDQARIVDILAVSQGEVSRLLGMARREGWLQTRCHLPEGALGRIERIVFSGRLELRQRLDRESAILGTAPVREIRVLQSGGQGPDPTGWDARLKRFSQAAAIRLQELLPSVNLVGVTWGKTIATLVDAFRQLNPNAPLLAEPVRFIPLAGEPLTYPDPETSSSMLAHRLNEIMNGHAVTSHSLAAVPAFIPAKFPATSRRVIREFIAEIAGYRQVFGENTTDGRAQKPLVEQLDAIVTGVGTVIPEASGRLLDDRIVAERITKEQLRERAIGDIGGVFVPRKERDPVVRGINDRWTGVRLEHIARCAQDAAQRRDRAGVVVIAIGNAKAQIILECVRRGLVNELVIDHDLAQSIIQIP